MRLAHGTLLHTHARGGLSVVRTKSPSSAPISGMGSIATDQQETLANISCTSTSRSDPLNSDANLGGGAEVDRVGGLLGPHPRLSLCRTQAAIGSLGAHRIHSQLQTVSPWISLKLTVPPGFRLA